MKLLTHNSDDFDCKIVLLQLMTILASKTALDSRLNWFSSSLFYNNLTMIYDMSIYFGRRFWGESESWGDLNATMLKATTVG